MKVSSHATYRPPVRFQAAATVSEPTSASLDMDGWYRRMMQFNGDILKQGKRFAVFATREGLQATLETWRLLSDTATLTITADSQAGDRLPVTYLIDCGAGSITTRESAAQGVYGNIQSRYATVNPAPVHERRLHGILKAIEAGEYQLQ